MNLPSCLADTSMWVDERQGDDTMPTITKLPTGEVILNVDHSVGRFGRNRRVDVQLVQFLLNLLIDTTKHFGPISNPALPTPEPLEMNGVCESKTIAAILWVQKSTNSGGQAYLAEDATVNHVEVMRYGSPSKVYTLWEIQMILELRHALPRSAADIPVGPLRSELARWFTMGLTLTT
jgi:hypothetical protein